MNQCLNVYTLQGGHLHRVAHISLKICCKILNICTNCSLKRRLRTPEFYADDHTTTTTTMVELHTLRKLHPLSVGHAHGHLLLRVPLFRDKGRIEECQSYCGIRILSKIATKKTPD